MAYSAIPRKEARRHARQPITGKIRLLWEDGHGRENVSHASVVNVSKNGLKARLDEKIPVWSYVYCNEEALGISGAACVRYCIYSKGKYEIGLEFGGGDVRPDKRP